MLLLLAFAKLAKGENEEEKCKNGWVGWSGRGQV